MDEPVQKPRQIQITLVTEAGWSTPPIVRLRRLLKLMKRGYGLRCVGLEPDDEKAEPTPEERAKGNQR